MKLSNYFKKEDICRLIFIFATVTGVGIIFLVLKNIGSITGFLSSLAGWILNVMSGFTGGLVLAYLLLGVVERLSRIYMRIPLLANKEKASRGLAIATTYILIFVAVFSLFTSIVIAITRQVTAIDFESLPRLIQELQIQITGLMNSMLETFEKIGIATDSMEELINNFRRIITGSLSGMGNGVFSFANNMTSFFANLLFAVIFSIYFMYDTKGLMGYWSEAFCALLGKRAHGVLAVLLKDADTCLSGYIRGQFADAVFMAIAITLLLSVIGVPYAFVIGVFAGIGNLVPYVGPFVAYGLTIGVCVASGEWSKLIIAVIAVFVLQTVDGNIVNPRLLSSSIDVHPVLVIVSLLFGSAIGGFAGMLLAVPVASFLKIQFERLVAWRLRCAS